MGIFLHVLRCEWQREKNLFVVDLNAPPISPQKMVTPAGFEPATFRSGGERSNPLSYGAALSYIDVFA